MSTQTIEGDSLFQILQNIQARKSKACSGYVQVVTQLSL